MIVINSILDVIQYLDGIDGAIFDLDDTLYSEKEYVRSGYRMIADQFPQVDHMAEKLWSVFKQGGKAIDEVFGAENILCYKEEALKIYRFHKPDIHLYEGVFEMLSRIRISGKKIGIITDGRPEGQRAKIEALQLGTLVDEIIITDELGGIEYRKPNEKAFCLMSKNLNVPFKKMVYIGDNPKKDFVAPERLRMRAIYFKNPEGLYSK